jgi:hypothetical protein
MGPLHLAITFEPPDAADGPVAARLGELVRVERQMRPMKATDTEMEDARHERRAIVARHRHPCSIDRTEGLRTKGGRGAITEPIVTTCMTIRAGPS